jgi:AcrR family transcriptional regulator
MSKPAKVARPRRARGSINPADIVSGAFDFFRGVPVDQWSIPQLATHLDVGVTSIYWYFRTKRELLQAMTESAAASFDAGMPAPHGDGWEELLRNFFLDVRRLLAADDLRCDLLIRRVGAVEDTGVREWPRTQQLFAALAEAGMPAPLAQHAFFTLSVYTQGFQLVQRTGSAPLNPAGPGEFEFGLNNILRGLRPLLPDAEDQADSVA